MTGSFMIVLVYQVPLNPWWIWYFIPLPICSTVSSVIWTYNQYKGAQVGGFRVYVEDVMDHDSNRKLHQAKKTTILNAVLLPEKVLLN